MERTTMATRPFTTQARATRICRRMVAAYCLPETAGKLTAILDAADKTLVHYADRHEWRTRSQVAAKLAEYLHSAQDWPGEYTCTAVNRLCEADYEAIPPLARSARECDTDLVRARRDAAR